MGNSQTALLKAEKSLLDSGIAWYASWKGTFPDPDSLPIDTITFETSEVPCSFRASGDDDDARKHHKTDMDTNLMHTVEYSAGSRAGTPLVVVHGYGSGVGMFFSSLPPLVERWDGPVYAVDMIGCGASSRPKWELGNGPDSDVEEVESYFVDALEAWRASMGLEKMVLMGHSIGGYVSVAYAERHVDRLERMILVSPVGLPTSDPPGVREEKLKNAPWYFRLASNLWEKGWTPYHFIRNGPGRFLLGKYSDKRFIERAWIDPDAKALFSEYVYTNWNNGEISAGGNLINTVLLPGAYARKPIGPRLTDMYHSGLQISFVYGTKDWMGWEHAKDAAEAAEAELRKGVSGVLGHAVGGAGGVGGAGAGGAGVVVGQFDVVLVADGGHNMMVDNPLGFVDCVMATAGGVGAGAGKTGAKGAEKAKDALLPGLAAVKQAGMQFPLERGAVLGYLPLHREAHGAGKAPFKVGDRVQCANKGGKDEGDVDYADVVKDNGDGTYKVNWTERAALVSSRFPGFKLQSVPPARADLVGACGGSRI